MLLEINNVCKTYRGGVKANDNISLSVAEGEVFGLLGPNGAGKTSLERKASNSILDFHRLDYPEMDPPEWNKLLPTKQVDGKVEVRELPLDFHLKPPYASSYEENYQKHSGV